MIKRKRVYITGFMGSGKTTTGKKLALLLRWDFLDLDTRIELQEKKSISEIFRLSGEEYFRQQEFRFLRNLDTVNDTVISVGGGAPCYADNLDFMKETGIVIYLRLKPEQLAARLAGGQESRPLIKGLGKGELLEFITAKLAEREKWYNQATIIEDGYRPDIISLGNKILLM
jgi:shikimate kinase